MIKLLLCICVCLFTIPSVFGQYKTYLTTFQHTFDKAKKIEEKKVLLWAMKDSVNFIMGTSHDTLKMEAYLKVCEILLKKILGTPSDKKFLPLAYFLVGHLYLQTNKRENLAYLYKAYDEAKKQGDTETTYASLDFITRFLFSSGEYEQVLPYFLAEERLLESGKISQKLYNYSSLLNSIALSYNHLKKYDKAIQYFQKCLTEAKISKDTAWIGLAYGNMAMVYLKQKDYEVALTCLRLDVKYSLLSKNKPSAMTAWMGIAEIYQIWQENKKASQAMDSAWALLAVIPSHETKMSMVFLYKTAYKFYKKNKEFEKLPLYADSLLSFFEKDASNSYKQDLQKIHAQYNVKFKEQELTLLQRRKDIDRWILYFVGSVAILVAVLAILLFRNNRKQKKTNHLLEEKQEEIAVQNEELNTQKEQLVSQNDTLQKINSTKDKLFSIVSHDFRSPLNALKSTAYLMSSENISPQEIKDLTQNVKTQIHHTSYFLENLLFWAKSQLKGFHISPEVFDLQEVVAENCELALPQNEEKHIVLENKIDKPVLILADKNMTRLVFRNLLSNATKYCKKGDTISLAYQIKQDEVQIVVQDTGLGMTEDQLACLFTPHTGSTYGTNNEKGAGLGLLLCHDFITHNGGKIWVESEIGKGSTFYFTLPVGKVGEEQLDEEFVGEQLENGAMLYRL